MWGWNKRNICLCIRCATSGPFMRFRFAQSIFYTEGICMEWMLKDAPVDGLIPAIYSKLQNRPPWIKPGSYTSCECVCDTNFHMAVFALNISVWRHMLFIRSKCFGGVKHNSTVANYSLRFSDVNICIAVAFAGNMNQAYGSTMFVVQWKRRR